MKGWICLTMRWRIRRHFAGRLPPEKVRKMWDHVAHCPDCRRIYNAHGLVGSLDPEARARHKENLSRVIFSPKVEGPGLARLVPALAGAALMVLLALWLWPPREAGVFEPRGEGRASLHVFVREVLHGQERAVPVDSLIQSNDGLLFAVSTDMEEARYVAILGWQERGRILWYHPAGEALDETSLAIPPLSRRHELRTVAIHALEPGNLTLLGLFSSRPLTVGEMEDLLEGQGEPESWPELVGSLEGLVGLDLQRLMVE